MEETFFGLLLTFLVPELTTAEYQSLRPCAQGCFGSTISMDTWYLANEIGCDPSPATEECICRPDLQAAADSYLTQCVYKSCDQNELDTNSAVSIYDSYCTAAGFMRENTPAPTFSVQSDSPLPTTSDLWKSTLESQITQSSTSVPTNKNPTSVSTSESAPAGTSPAGSRSNGKGSLGTGEMIGIIVAVVGVIATAIGVWISYRAFNKAR
ncbi:hypothetical protein BKA64DRAFT_659651 [Cadophora sp. MPI-SDFR-AT-0126]|nr:hypothetical protein BKA64DRAFT_659651 [Leotiomycetes sp. MPI-SDFR-AT-0126]